MLKVGSVVAFNYDQSHTHDGRRVIKVTNIRDTRALPIVKKSKGPEIRRSRYLVTGVDTESKWGSFYTDEFSDVQVLGLFARLKLWLSGKRFG